MIGPVFLFGALLGIRHALEADHIAAVASLATRTRSTREIVAMSAAWGFGHATSLVLVGSLVIALGMTISEHLSQALEIGVGLMLVALGIDVLRRLRRSRIHVHPHRHTDGTLHLHLHRHEPRLAGRNHSSPHEHDHPPLSRALLVGGVHGLAGSAALILLSAQATSSLAAAIAYLVAFGIGSVVGMMVFSLAISIPIMRWSARRFEKNWARVEAALGIVTIAIGAWVALHAGGS